MRGFISLSFLLQLFIDPLVCVSLGFLVDALVFGFPVAETPHLTPLSPVLTRDISNIDSERDGGYKNEQGRIKKQVLRRREGVFFACQPCIRQPGHWRRSGDGIDESDHMSIGRVGCELASGSGGLREPLPGALPVSSVALSHSVFLREILCLTVSLQLNTASISDTRYKKPGKPLQLRLLDVKTSKQERVINRADVTV